MLKLHFLLYHDLIKNINRKILRGTLDAMCFKSEKCFKVICINPQEKEQLKYINIGTIA